MSKNIVIIGAANAGHMTASSIKLPTSLLSTHRIILIDPAPVAYWPLASLRGAVVPGWEKKVYHTLSQETVWGKGSKNVLVKQKVVKLEAGGVVIDGEFEGSSVIPFEALVIATGASQPFPMRPKQEWSVDQIEAELVTLQKNIENASSILILGGGPTGVEFAGEILDRYPKTKKITLIHKNPHLIDSRSYSKLATTLEQKLAGHGVELILGDEHVEDEGFKTGKQEGLVKVRTKGGKVVETDYIFLAVGNKPNTQLIAEADPSALASNGLIKVNDHLQVSSMFFSTPNVFAVGDCADSPGWRSLISAQADAGTVAANVVAALNGGGLKKHKAGARAMVVPLGPGDGAGFAQMPLLGDSLLPTFAVKKIKGATLFTEMLHKRFVA